MNDTVPNNEPLPTYNYDRATEGERWAYDQGSDAGFQEALNPQSMDEVREVLAVLGVALERLIAEEGAS